MGVIIRDEKGFVIAALNKTIMEIYDLVFAEASVALCAVELCREVGVHDIFLEGDSQLVVKAIFDLRPSWIRYGQIIDDIRMVLRSLRSWKIRHVKRETNEAAHKLAKGSTLLFN